VLLTNEVNETL